jgi:hypothetical protein
MPDRTPAPRWVRLVVSGGFALSLAALSGCATRGFSPAGNAVPAPLGAPAPVAAEADDGLPPITQFSTAQSGRRLPKGWVPFLLGPTKRTTNWLITEPGADTPSGPIPPESIPPEPILPEPTPSVRLAVEAPAPDLIIASAMGNSAAPRPRRALRGVADRSASGVAHPVGRRLARGTHLAWSWRVDLPPPDGDPGDREREDSAMRVALSFDGDRSTMPARELALSELSLLVTGKELPYATLVYSWAADRRIGEVVIDPRTTRVRTVVVANRAVGLRQWIRSRRDVWADFQVAFGETPGVLQGVALFVDADHTNSHAVGWYGDVALEAPPKEGR